MPARRVKRIYRHYSTWEEAKAGMWRRPTGREREYLIERCAEFMADTPAFVAAMHRALKEWPVSCEVNFTAKGNNRVAWLGWAASCIAIECPEEPTRAAWWRLTQAQRDLADAGAAEAIRLWERRYNEQESGVCLRLALE